MYCFLLLQSVIVSPSKVGEVYGLIREIDTATSLSYYLNVEKAWVIYNYNDMICCVL